MLVFCVFLPVPFLLVHHLRRLCGEKRHLVEAMRTRGSQKPLNPNPRSPSPKP